MSVPRYLLIGNPGGKRLTLYQQELTAYWASRGVVPEVVLLPWRDIIPRDGKLQGIPELDKPAVLRFESHGKDDQVYKLLLEAGARERPGEAWRVWKEETIPLGLIWHPSLAFVGLTRVMNGITESLKSLPDLQYTAEPASILKMFDKYATIQAMQVAGITTPKLYGLLQPLTVVHYLKLNTGSSACGMMLCGPSTETVSTVVPVTDNFYNTRRLRKLSNTEFIQVNNFLQRQGSIIQAAIPKAMIHGQNFDVRVVCVNAKPVATIFRVSRHPMTNLHLGGHRGDWVTVRASIPTRNWLDGLDMASDAAACFNSTIAGVDLLFEQNSYKPYILEVNAYGDFFPGWVDSQGHSCHWHEIDATAKKYFA